MSKNQPKINLDSEVSYEYLDKDVEEIKYQNMSSTPKSKTKKQIKFKAGS